MTRISRHMMFMDMAEIAAKRSTCFRGNMGALLVDPMSRNIIAMGYNGPRSGEPHCKGMICEKNPDGGCARSIHAEINAINRGKITTKDILGMHLYASAGPCPNCSQAIIDEGLSRVYYRHPYRIVDGLQLMMDRGIGVYRISSAGVIISERTGLALPDGHV